MGGYKAENLRKASIAIKLANKRTYEDNLGIELKTTLERLFSYIIKRTTANGIIPILELRGARAETNVEKVGLPAVQFSSGYSPKSSLCTELPNCLSFLSSEGFTVDEMLQTAKVVKPYQSPES